MTEDKIKAVRLVFEQAEAVEPAPEDVPAALPEDGGGGGGAAGGAAGLGEMCPVVPLGIAGQFLYFMDDSRQIREIKHKDMSRLNVAGLFGARIPWLYNTWPRVDKDGNKTGWRPEKAAEQLIAAAHKAGPFDVNGRVRGPGAWLGEQGELLLHCGDAIVASRPPKAGAAAKAEAFSPGHLGPYFYPAAAPRPRPATKPAATWAKDGPSAGILELIGKWKWSRALDAHLMLGWICCAVLGGALKWRPLIWCTGDRFTGKSSLHEFVNLLLGGAIVTTAETSAAGIWQNLQFATLPVALDELEPEADNRKVDAVIKLARLAASGSLILRGGADHQGSQFVARSCFFISSIHVPPLKPQDRSRIAVLDLEKLPQGSSAPSLAPGPLGELGRALRRRLVDNWPRHAETLELYRQALMAVGLSGRGADLFGNLLAGADLAMHDEPPSADELDAWAERVAGAQSLELADDASDHERMIDHLTTWVDLHKPGSRVPLGHHIAVAAGRGDGSQEPGANYEANRMLQSFGLKVWAGAGKLGQGGGRRDGLWLAVANGHQGLQQVFQGTHWAAASGAGGVWSQACKRVPGWARPATSQGHIKLGERPHRVTLLPIDALLPPDENEGA